MGNVPKLRFSDFEGDWQTTRLNSLVTSIDSGWSPNCDSRPAKSNEWGVLKTTSVTWSGYDENENKKLPDSLVARPNIEVQENDILITRAGPVNRVGVVALVSSTRPKLMLSDKLIRLRSCKEVYPPFLSRSISGAGVQKYLAARKSGLAEAQANISQDILRKAPVKVPPTKLEQQKIADFLTAVDTKIEQLTQKEVLLKQYKKGVMQKIFSQEIRFKADDGSEFPEWEDNHLSDLVDIQKGSQLNKDTLTEQGTYPALNGGINPSGYTNDWNTESGTVTISEGGNSCGYVNLVKTRFWSGGHNYSLQKVKASTSSQYLYQYLKFLEPKIMRLRVGSGLPNIQKGDLSCFEMKLPCLKEQEKISGLLGGLDEKIRRSQEQISSAKTFKKGLLQQMFC